MNIAIAAERSGLPAKTIRYYEDIDLIKPARGPNGYRDYCARDVETLSFLQRARSLGFSLDECRLLLSLYRDSHRSSAEVKAIAEDKIVHIDRKLVELKALRKTLSTLVANCHGDAEPECPIIDTLAGQSGEGN
ncbi:Cu(I)-responsive transcriptional regulator [Pseudohoeflea coraliihabitans]|uniref:Cu(I)-responsive transcriptional regulator n=1 Tax=Pseudohoeflea coraliihabitans TaxID=2860393 RepID=A0ABS6WS17_9HYPH|nr:Cu(I)-responsive transcriptional regulator [Pseudohoeflea sp. DP4N28-3]MBW3098585.1 Cu(I)-responsive transcriptional regulator [Pseudohoeflea sp. DP4N28-3]